MPRLNGWETLTALRRLSPDLPVILSSGYDKGQVMAGDHPELPQVFLCKPYKLKDLGDADIPGPGRRNGYGSRAHCRFRLKSTKRAAEVPRRSACRLPISRSYWISRKSSARILSSPGSASRSHTRRPFPEGARPTGSGTCGGTRRTRRGSLGARCRSSRAGTGAGRSCSTAPLPAGRSKFAQMKRGTLRGFHSRSRLRQAREVRVEPSERLVGQRRQMVADDDDHRGFRAAPEMPDEPADRPVRLAEAVDVLLHLCGSASRAAGRGHSGRSSRISRCCTESGSMRGRRTRKTVFSAGSPG